MGKIEGLRPEERADRRTVGRIAEQRRARVTVTCEQCGKELPGSVAWRRFCGPTCRQRAHRKQPAGEDPGNVTQGD